MSLIKKLAVPLYAISFLGLLLSVACNNDRAIPISSDLIGGDDLGKVLQTTKPAITDSSAGKAINTQVSALLLLGALKDIECRILLRFDTPDLFLQTSQVASVKLKLPADSAQGQTGSIDATVHQVTSPWDEASVTWGQDPFPVTFNPMIDRQSITASEADTVSFNLTPQTIASWFDTSSTKRDTAGVMLQASGATFLKEFHSRFSSEKTPFLELTLNRPAKSDTTVFRSATKSVFVFRRLAPLAADRIYIGDGEKLLSALYFDLKAARPDTIPRSATISRAMLILDIDTENSIFPDIENALSVSLLRSIKKHTLLTFASNADSVFFVQASAIRGADKSVKLNVTGIVQSWVRDGIKPNDYFVLFPNFTGISFLRVAFYSSNSDPARAPRLQIEYTTPPE
jgi:hypothetical protein